MIGLALAVTLLGLSVAWWSSSGGPATTPAGRAAGTQGCAETVRAARAAVAAAQPSYENWSGHVQAQLDLDAGISTIEQTRERWADTRSTSEADLSGFADSLRAYRLVDAGCANLVAGTSPDSEPCRDEFSAASEAVGAAERVVGEWDEHIDMMANREQSEPGQYREQWREMVTAAPTALREFERAAGELRAIPQICS